MNSEQQPPILENYRLLGPGRIFMEPDDSTIQLNGPSVSENRDFSFVAVKGLRDKDRLELRITRDALLHVFTDPDDANLQPVNLSDILPKYKDNEPAKQKAFDRLARFMTSGYFPEGELSLKERHALVQNAVSKANEYIAHFENQSTGMLKDFVSSVGINNEVQSASNPIDLVLITLSPRASRKMRYEARRKLVLIDLALHDMAYVRQERIQQQDIEAFMRFLGKNLWQGGSGQTAHIEMVSEHSPMDNACTGVTFLRPQGGRFDKPFSTLWFHGSSSVAEEQDGMNLFLSQYHRYTAVQARVWRDDKGNLQWAVFDHREKRVIDKMIKMMRKDTKDPRIIDDAAGFKFIVEDKRSIYTFLETLQEHAVKNGFLFSITDVSDTIDNEDDYLSGNKGSNKKVEMVKFNILFQGHNIQLLLHTPRSYLDYQYRDGTGWAYYEINRAIDSGLLDHLYPKDIYGIDFQILQKELHKTRRRELQKVSFASIPEERRRDAQLQIEYTPFMKDQDVLAFERQFRDVGFSPKVIYCIGENVLPVAVSLGKTYQAQLVIWQKEINEVRPQIPQEINPADVLILDDIAVSMKTAMALRSELPGSKIAFIIDKRQSGTEKPDEIDFTGRVATEKTWIFFSMT